MPMSRWNRTISDPHGRGPLYRSADAAGLAFIEPATRLYCKNRISIGPLKSGMRRLALSPIAYGSSGAAGDDPGLPAGEALLQPAAQQRM